MKPFEIKASVRNEDLSLPWGLRQLLPLISRGPASRLSGPESIVRDSHASDVFASADPLQPGTRRCSVPRRHRRHVLTPRHSKDCVRQVDVGHGQCRERARGILGQTAVAHLGKALTKAGLLSATR